MELINCSGNLIRGENPANWSETCQFSFEALTIFQILGEVLKSGN